MWHGFQDSAPPSAGAGRREVQDKGGKREALDKRLQRQAALAFPLTTSGFSTVISDDTFSM